MAFPLLERASRGLKPKRRLLIVGEGQNTEPNYFYGLKLEELVTARFNVTVKKGPGISPQRVMDVTVNLKKSAERNGVPYDEVWCVMDVEGLEKRSSLLSALATAAKEGINVWLSNPSFEVWLMSHLKRCAPCLLNGMQAVRELAPLWQQRFQREYKKSEEELYELVSPLTQTAIENAQWVREKHHLPATQVADCNSSTEVYRLVKHLLGR